MCDYSAEGVDGRDSFVGDLLVSGSISMHTNGMVCRNDPSMAVCLYPGTRVILTQVPSSFMEAHGLTGSVHYAEFKQYDRPREQGFRDFFVFDESRAKSLLQDLPMGILIEVEFVPAAHRPDFENPDVLEPESLEPAMEFAEANNPFPDQGRYEPAPGMLGEDEYIEHGNTFEEANEYA